MVRTFVPVTEHLDVLADATQKLTEHRRKYRYKGVVKEEVWGLKFKVGQEVLDAQSGERGTIVASTNRQVIAVHRP